MGSSRSRPHRGSREAGASRIGVAKLELRDQEKSVFRVLPTGWFGSTRIGSKPSTSRHGPGSCKKSSPTGLDKNQLDLPLQAANRGLAPVPRGPGSSVERWRHGAALIPADWIFPPAQVFPRAGDLIPGELGNIGCVERSASTTSDALRKLSASSRLFSLTPQTGAPAARSPGPGRVGRAEGRSRTGGPSRPRERCQRNGRAAMRCRR